MELKKKETRENKMQNKTIQIQVQDGVVIDVLNLPSGVDYEIIDLDTSHAEEL